jgi:hypothetical protein
MLKAYERTPQRILCAYNERGDGLPPETRADLLRGLKPHLSLPRTEASASVGVLFISTSRHVGRIEVPAGAGTKVLRNGLGCRSQQNRKDIAMLTRLLVAACCVVLLSGCDEGSKDESKQASICKGLNQADCTANAECRWNAEKEKCKPKKQNDAQPQQSTPPSAEPATPPETTPGAAPQ